MEPPPKELPVTDPLPWIEHVMPPEEQKRPPVEDKPDPVMVITEKPPVIMPPPPDITPISIVPWEIEDPIPEPLPEPPTEESRGGAQPPTRPPPTIIAVGAIAPVGTFMVYLGKRLLLSMAASTGSQLGAHFGAMLVGPLGKTMARGVRLRYHTGVSPGARGVDSVSGAKAASYFDAWRALPQEFSYWEK